MKFNLAEKLAIVKVIDEIIISDGEIDQGELDYLNQLMNQLEFNMDFVNEARQLNATEALLIISNMTSLKKNALRVMMHEMAMADGEIHEMEAQTIMAVWQNTGMMEGLEVEEKLDLSDIYFESRDHIRHQNGAITSGPHSGGAKRAIKIENNINGNEGYSVTIYNLDGDSIWGDQVQMAPKQMKVIEESKDKIVLRGYGSDRFGSSFSDYGLTVHLEGPSIHSMVLHMHDRAIDIEYLP
jgi:uncharacterized tellurite resistance protein B-like protein